LIADYIYNKTQSIVKGCETRDPIKIAKELGIMVTFCDSWKSLKGLYTIIKRQRVIILNSNLPEQKQKVICAHELGHDMLHRHLATQSPFKEFLIYNMTSRAEYQANMVAADLLLDDEDVQRLMLEGCDPVDIAAELETDINLIGIKLWNMNYRGHGFNLCDRPRGDFLGR
jgi:Zn-dependent peptidase ImmA (M78 family)